MKLSQLVLVSLVFASGTAQAQRDTNKVVVAKKTKVEPRSEKCKVVSKNHSDNLLIVPQAKPKVRKRDSCPGCGMG